MEVTLTILHFVVSFEVVILVGWLGSPKAFRVVLNERRGRGY